MKNELIIFKSEEFGEIRTLEIDNKPYFVGKDIAEALGYENTQKAIKDHVDEEDKKMGEQNVTPYILDNLGRKQYPIYINESGLYSLIMASKLPNAKKFKRWVTAEVLPSIRKNGGYIVGQENLSDEELLKKAILVATRKIEEKDKQLEEQKPKVLFANSVESSHTSILVGELAKIIKQSLGIELGQNRFFKWLRDKGYLIVRKGTDYNMPTQKSMDLGLFEIKESTILHADGHVSVTKTPKITGKGQVYFIDRFSKSLETN